MLSDQLNALELMEKAATSGRWICEDEPSRDPHQCCVTVTCNDSEVGHNLFDTLNRGYKESELRMEPPDEDNPPMWYDVRGIKDLNLVCAFRNAAPEVIAVLRAADCIKHWHDTGRNNEGMIVSSEKVRGLWAALDALSAVLPSVAGEEVK